MASGKRSSGMVIPTAIMALLALTLVVIAVRRGDGSHLQGLNAT